MRTGSDLSQLQLALPVHPDASRENSQRNPSRSCAGLATATKAYKPPDQPAGWVSLSVEVGLHILHLPELLELVVGKRRVANCKHALYPPWSRSDTPPMGEAVERCFASVSPLSRISHTAERQGGDGGVVESIVNAGATRASRRQDLVGLCFGTEGIQAQGRRVHSIGSVDSFV